MGDDSNKKGKSVGESIKKELLDALNDIDYSKSAESMAEAFSKAITNIGDDIKKSKLNAEFGKIFKTIPHDSTKNITDELVKAINEAVNIAGGTVGVEANISGKELDKLSDSINARTRDISDRFGEMLSKVFGSSKYSALFGDTINNAIGKSKKAFADTHAQTKSTYKSLGAGLKSLLTEGTSGLTALFKSGLFWVSILGMAIMGLFNLAFDYFKKLQETMANIRQETGLIIGQVERLESITQAVNIQYGDLGVSMENAGKASISIANEMINIDRISGKLVSSVALMKSNLGMSEEESALLLRNFMDIGSLTEDQSTAMVGFTKQLALAGRIAPKKVLSDMAKSSAELNKWFRGNVKEFAKAAVYANKLGLEIKDLAKVSDGLLEFDTSIENELYAGIMLNKQLDFSNARMMAFEGNIAGATDALLNQFGSIEDFNKLNVLQKKAIADASGLEIEQISKSLKMRQALGKLTVAERKEYENATKALEKNDELTGARLLKEARMQTQMQRIETSWNNIKDIIGQWLLPLIELMANGLEKTLGAVNSIAKAFTSGDSKKLANEGARGIGEGIVDSVAGGVASKRSWLGDTVSSLIKGVLIGIGLVIVVKGIMILGKAFSTVGGFLGKILGGFADLIMKPFKAIMSGIGNAVKGLTDSIRGISKSFVDIATFAFLLGAVAGSMYLFALGFEKMKDVPWQVIAAGMGGMVGVLYALSPAIIALSKASEAGAIGMAIFAGVVAVVGASLWLAKDGILAMGSAIQMIYDSIFGGISKIVNAFANVINGIANVFSSMKNGAEGLKIMADIGVWDAIKASAGFALMATSLAAVSSATGGFESGAIGLRKLMDSFKGLSPITQSMLLFSGAVTTLVDSLQKLQNIDSVKIEKVMNASKQQTSMWDVVTAGVGKVLGTDGNSNNKSDNVSPMDEIVKKLDTLISAVVNKNTDVYLDGKLVGRGLSNAAYSSNRI